MSSERGGSRSEKRVSVNALFVFDDDGSMTAAACSCCLLSSLNRVISEDKTKRFDRFGFVLCWIGPSPLIEDISVLVHCLRFSLGTSDINSYFYLSKITLKKIVYDLFALIIN